MPKKPQIKSSAEALELKADGVRREIVRSEAFVSIYVNDVQVQTFPWDLRLLLGQIDDPATRDAPVVTIKQLGELRMSPQLAKRLTVILMEQLAAYEKHFGTIPAPDNA